MSNEFSNMDDVIDVRDIIARYEEIEDTEAADELEELATLTGILSELDGMGGDEQWRGDWYPVTLIRNSYFENAMDEMLDDIGELPKDLPYYLSITVDYHALQMDYSSIEIDGVTYWTR